MSKYYLSVKTYSRVYEHFEVPEPVYNYVRQLEMAIRTLNTEGLENQYPERFATRDIMNKDT
jgi:hypothetical protein